jgi:hypothetical protein
VERKRWFLSVVDSARAGVKMTWGPLALGGWKPSRA